MTTLISLISSWFSSSKSTSSSSSSSSSSIKDKTFSWLGNLIKLLPTGTVFVYQFLNPVLTNNGHCDTLNKKLSSVLIGLCGLSCIFSCFTDSYKGTDNKLHYGVVTIKGLWPTADSGSSVDLSMYKLRFSDFVHAFFSAIVFAGLSLFDTNTVECFYPSFEGSETKKVLMQVLPPVIGAISGTVFMMFPNKRHGIGYPLSTDDDSASSATSKA